MEPKIIFEDDDILVIDKPAGWIVNDADSAKGQNILQSWLSKMDYPLAGSREYRSGIVHRLDKETSGVLVVAKTKEAFEKFQKEFKERKVEKTYTALVHGKVEPAEGEIQAPVGRLPWRRDRFGVLPGGREARTDYKVVKYFEVGSSKWEDGNRSEKLESNPTSHIGYPTSHLPLHTSFSLLELYPKTGRTHQIRIHLKYLGYPVVADEFYAGRKTARNDRKWCPRLFLHASKIQFFHPTSGQVVSFNSELSEDLKTALETLQKT